MKDAGWMAGSEGISKRKKGIGCGLVRNIHSFRHEETLIIKLGIQEQWWRKTKDLEPSLFSLSDNYWANLLISLSPSSVRWECGITISAHVGYSTDFLERQNPCLRMGPLGSGK